MVDYLARQADVVVRCQGGNNAGHTVVNEYGTFSLHLVPSGVCHPRVTNVLGPGMVIDLEALVNEIETLDAAGVGTANIYVSDRATICFPFHRQEDVWEEERLGRHAYGSTRKGIAPAYGDRYLKKAIQVGDLLNRELFERRLRDLWEWKSLMTSGLTKREAMTGYEELLHWSETFGGKLRERIRDTTALLEGAVADGKSVLFESQLGALRDIYFGIYPYTTSACTLAAYAPVGGGLFSRAPARVVGVMKAFSTCVGAGPFPAEMTDEEAGPLRETAKEFGATTGRPRRIGHFDAVASRYGADLQNATEIALTKLDCLSGQEKLLVCTRYEVDGRDLELFPLHFEGVRPRYVEFDGWAEEITGCVSFDELPTNAQNYVLAVERMVGRPIRFVSVGPGRDQLIDRGQG